MTSLANSFWERMRLEEKDRATCLEAIQRRYDGYTVEEFAHQGYCSFTLLLSPGQEHCMDENRSESGVQIHGSPLVAQIIVQLRPAQFALDLDMTSAATKIYSTFVSEVQNLELCLPGGLCAFEMNRLKGTPMSGLRPLQRSITVETWKKQGNLVASFAKAIAKGWPRGLRKHRRDSVLLLEPAPTQKHTMLSQCTGKVGLCIAQKLERLAQQLPDVWLQQRAKFTLERLCMVNEYPVVLNHGDLILSNILVDSETWEITGLVDWAEAEYLPFGTCLYGLEHILGFFQQPSQESGGAAFVYYDNASQLRKFFWNHLTELVPELEFQLERVVLMRDVGVLLWHGYAWDEGAIDRVVDEANDSEELVKLRAFLSV